MARIESGIGSPAVSVSSSRPRQMVVSQGRTMVRIDSPDNDKAVEVVGGGNGDRGRPEFFPKAECVWRRRRWSTTIGSGEGPFR